MVKLGYRKWVRRMQNLRIAICEDERIHAVLIQNALLDYFFHCGCGKDFDARVFSSAEELLQASDDYDIILMDIGLGGMDGIEAAKLLRKRGSATPTIYITALARYRDGYGSNVIGYLDKPIDQQRFNEVMDEAITYLNFSGQRLRVSFNCVEYLIPIRDILYIEICSHNRKIHYVRTNGELETVMVSNSWSEILPQLSGFRFAAPHKSYLVNLDWILSVTSAKVEMKIKSIVLPVSQGKKKEFQEHFINFTRNVVGGG